MNKESILILCTGNSARSQMAEAYFKKFGSHRFDASSAGLEPRPIHPMTIKVMGEDGIDISQNRSKPIKEFLGRHSFQTVFFVCQNAERNCPAIFPFSIKRVSWPFEDPAAFEGSEEEKLGKFREIRDQIKKRVEAFVFNEVGGSHDQSI